VGRFVAGRNAQLAIRNGQKRQGETISCRPRLGKAFRLFRALPNCNIPYRGQFAKWLAIRFCSIYFAADRLWKTLDFGRKTGIWSRGLSRTCDVRLWSKARYELVCSWC
jgi:hypothetical protein